LQYLAIWSWSQSKLSFQMGWMWWFHADMFHEQSVRIGSVSRSWSKEWGGNEGYSRVCRVYISNRATEGRCQFSEANYNTLFSKYIQGVFIDVHSHGQYVGWPWGFTNQRTPNDEGLGTLGRKLASFNGYRLWAPTMPNRQCELLFWPANNVHLASIICSQYLINCWTLLFVQMDSMAEP